MARRGRPTVEITLGAQERQTLQRWARRHRSSQALALRSKIVLACAEGTRTHAQIAAVALSTSWGYGGRSRATPAGAGRV